MVRRVHSYADGGKVVKDHLAKKMKKPESGGKPKRITTKNPPGGDQTPVAKGTYKAKKMADGGAARKHLKKLPKHLRGRMASKMAKVDKTPEPKANIPAPTRRRLKDADVE